MTLNRCLGSLGWAWLAATCACAGVPVLAVERKVASAEVFTPVPPIADLPATEVVVRSADPYASPSPFETLLPYPFGHDGLVSTSLSLQPAQWMPSSIPEFGNTTGGATGWCSDFGVMTWTQSISSRCSWFFGGMHWSERSIFNEPFEGHTRELVRDELMWELDHLGLMPNLVAFAGLKLQF